MKTLIVDDEPLARAYLRRMLETLNERDIIEAEDAGQALQKAETERPDLLFLDIQMPGPSGLQMAAALDSLDSPPLLVFVTGYSEHALAAFEHNALDYLVKPVSRDRLTKTLTRAREQLALRAAGKSKPEETKHSTRGVTESSASALAPLTRLPIREDYTVRFIRVEEIVCAVAKEKRVSIRTSDGEKRTYYTLTQLESLLPAELFLRIHDSCIVNLEHIQEVHSLGSHSYVVRLTGGLQLPVSRSRYPVLQRRLGLGVLHST
jgi:two-component system LytT family response regulator